MGWILWKRGETRRASIQTVVQLHRALASGDAQQLLLLVAQPSAIRDRTATELSEFLIKALRDEISPEGLQVLSREAEYGSLTNLFPAEAQAWCAQAQVRPEDCVAFKLERNGIRAEVVLLREPPSLNPDAKPSDQFRIVRCNNVKQLANVAQP